MTEGKRYYWLKLKEDFFSSKRIKKLRNMAGGDTYTIIYLKLQLLAMKTEGILTWTGLEDNFADELALDIDEKADDVSVTLMYLINTGLAETQNDTSLFLPWVIENTGSETAAAERMRKMRERNNVTPVLQERYGEIEKEKEIEKRDREKSKSKKFVPPTLEEVKAYVSEKGYNVDAQKFFDFYSEGDWIDSKGKPVRNWKQKLITWANKEPQSKYVVGKEYQNGRKIDTELLERLKGGL